MWAVAIFLRSIYTAGAPRAAPSVNFDVQTVFCLRNMIIYMHPLKRNVCRSGWNARPSIKLCYASSLLNLHVCIFCNGSVSYLLRFGYCRRNVSIQRKNHRVMMPCIPLDFEGRYPGQQKSSTSTGHFHLLTKRIFVTRRVSSILK